MDGFSASSKRETTSEAVSAELERTMTIANALGRDVLCRLVFAGARTSRQSGDLGARWRDERPVLEFYDPASAGEPGEPGLFLDSCLAERLDAIDAKGVDLALETSSLELVAAWALEQATQGPFTASPRRRRLSSLAEQLVERVCSERAILPL